MQKLFHTVSEGSNTVPASPDTPAARAAEPAEPAAARTFAWPPPEEDLDDWHVFKFAETPKTTAPAATLASAPAVVPVTPPQPAHQPAHQPTHPPATVVRMPLNGASSPSLRRVTAPVSPAPPAALTQPALTPQPALTRPALAQPAPSTWGWIPRAAITALALLAIGEAAYIAAPLFRTRALAQARAMLVVQSQPTVADVTIDGQPRGQTPLRLELTPGQHVLELRKDRLLRRLPLVLDAGGRTTQYIELRASDADPAAAPSASVSASAPTSASTPVSAPATAPGTSAPNAPPPEAVVRPAPTVGWLVVQSPLTLSILRNGELIGNSDEGRLKIAPGHHEVELSNTAAGYREATTIQVVAGQQTVLRPDLPQSTIDLASTPSAKVLIDGQDVGETPLSQIALTIGSHDILFRHPDFGDRHVTTFIKVGTPARAFVDFSTQ